jgi:hypothetical protein
MHPVSIAWRAALTAALCGVAYQAWVLPAQLTALVNDQANSMRLDLDGQLADTRWALNQDVADTRKDLVAQVSGLRSDLRTEANAYRSTLNVQAQYATDKLVGQLREFRWDLAPTLTAIPPAIHNIQELATTYNAVPTLLAQELTPSWEALQPEITCRTLTGQGYGGCWHSRITGLFGEAEKVGGVFTQKFPTLVDSVNGITTDARAWTDKYVMPHPQTFGQKVWSGFKTGGAIGIGLARAGIF